MSLYATRADLEALRVDMRNGFAQSMRRTLVIVTTTFGIATTVLVAYLFSRLP